MFLPVGNWQVLLIFCTSSFILWLSSLSLHHWAQGKLGSAPLFHYVQTKILSDSDNVTNLAQGKVALFLNKNKVWSLGQFCQEVNQYFLGAQNNLLVWLAKLLRKINNNEYWDIKIGTHNQDSTILWVSVMLIKTYSTEHSNTLNYVRKQNCSRLLDDSICALCLNTYFNLSCIYTYFHGGGKEVQNY